ncbi:glycosyltransferase [Sphingobium sp. EM0848]|uniref:glycosyltransferase n=1 Tax=Sphingobium sp. EM0848 TaxID=2743473 RepID=UPI00159C77CD|nr:glycosyltransferase [Sphingobium sp. EM0848]
MNAVEIPPYFWGLATLALCLLVFPLLHPTNRLHRLIVSGAAILSILVYMGWRLVATLDLTTPVAALLSIGFFMLEVCSTLGGMLVLFVLTRRGNRSQDVARNIRWLRTTQPTAAIFICTYNEEVGILERTLTGALNQSYPAKVYMLDDGHRPEVEALCRRRGVEWLTRTDNRHAKAGNMNAGIATLAARGEMPDFVAILDADFVPLPNFMKRSIALFKDAAVGVVQTPQHFFNPDPLQHRIKGHLDLPDEQRFFFDTLLPAKDGWNTAFSCGTSSVVRTSALTQIGGFPTDSITEDMLLSIRMKEHGFFTAYLNEKLSLGLAPEGIGEYCTQRIRWCVGAMQIVRSADGLFSRRPLSWIDRMSLAETLLYWVGSFPFRLACLLVPILYWTTGLTIMDAPMDQLAAFLLPRILVEAFAISWYSNGRIMPLLTDTSQLLIAPEIVAASLHTLLFPGERPFKVTNKGGDRSHTVIHWKLLSRFAIVLLFTAMGMLVSYCSPLAPTFFSDQKGVVAFWSMYNVLVCIMAMIVCVETPRRADERAPIGGTAVFSAADSETVVQLLDISSSGVAFANEGGWKVGDRGTISIKELGEMPASIARITDNVVGAKILLSPQQQTALTHFQFAGERMRTPDVSTLGSFIALIRGLALS